MKRPNGANVPFTQELADAICLAISTQPKSLKNICADEGFPSHVTVHAWLAKHADFAAAYVKARERQAEVFIDDALEIADETPEHETQASVGRAKLKVDLRMRIVPMLNRGRYGDKLALTGGGDNDPAIKTQDVTPLKRAKAIALVVARAKGATPGE